VIRLYCIRKYREDVEEMNFNEFNPENVSEKFTQSKHGGGQVI